MFTCRMCAENPLVLLFSGGAPEAAEEEKQAKQEKQKKSHVKPDKPKNKPRDEASFQARSPEEVTALIKRWEQYAHPRSREFFNSNDMLAGILGELAKGIDKNCDPVLGDDKQCVFWYGDVTKDDQQAAIRMQKPGDTTESVTYVNRVLAFIFATDESFEALMRLPKEPFKMSCGNQLCCHLAHISLSV